MAGLTQTRYSYNAPQRNVQAPRPTSSYRPIGASIPFPQRQQPQPAAPVPAPEMPTWQPPQQTQGQQTFARGTMNAAQTFTPTQLTKPQRQVVNEPGKFDQQTEGVNARLAQLLDPSYADVRTTDRDVNPLVQSIDRQSQQTARLMQAQMAERAAAEGTLEGGGFSNMQTQIMEQARNQAGDQTAQLMWDKSRERQGQIQQALQLGAGLIDQNQERNLRRELADLENEQKFQGLSLQRDLGFGDLNLRSQLGNRGMDIQHELGLGDLDVRRQGLSLQEKLGMGDLDLRGRGLDQDDRHFYDELGFNRSKFESDMNARIAGGLFGGY